MTSAKRILCATDFLETGAVATDIAAALASELHLELVLVHAADVGSLLDYADSPSFSTVAQAAMRRQIDERLDTARAALQAEQDRLKAAGVNVRTELRAGRPWKALCEVAEEAPGLVVVGAHDPNDDAPALAGTTATRIIQHTALPVLVATGAAPKTWRGIRMVVGIDFSDHALAAARAAQAWAAALGGEARLLYATPPLPKSPALPNPDPALEEEMERSGETRLSSWCDEHQLSMEGTVRPGIPEEVLLQEATDGSADLIIVGTRGHSRMGELLLGSTTERLLNRAPVPVLAIEAQ